MTKELTQLSIAYLDSFGFEADGSIFWIKTSIQLKRIKIYFKNLVNLNLSRDFLDLDDNDLTVVDITHEYRKITLDDFHNYQYMIDRHDNCPKFHLVTFHGSIIISIICEKLEIEEI